MGDTEQLSHREEEILLHAANGLTDKEIARDLSVSLWTVKSYWTRIRRKLNAASRSHAIATKFLADSKKLISQTSNSMDVGGKLMPLPMCQDSGVEHCELCEFLDTGVCEIRQDWSGVSSSPLYVLVMSPNGTIRFVNQPIGAMKVSQLVGHALEDFSPESGRIEFRTALQTVLETGKATSVSGLLNLNGRGMYRCHLVLNRLHHDGASGGVVAVGSLAASPIES